VVHDNRAVSSGVDIELDSVGAELDRAKKGGDRVLGQRVVRTPV
jgi:hypothetical protein